MKVKIEKQGDGSYIAYNVDGDKVQLIGTGESVREAKEDFFNSIEEVRAEYSGRGAEVPGCLSEEEKFIF